MTRQLRKTIMHCSRLKNIFKKNCTAKTWDSCKIQCNFYVNQKTKKDYFENINVNNTNNKKSSGSQ